LLKLRHPECRVVVHEQGTPDSTFGFGVGLANRTQRNLQAADPTTLADIVAHSWSHDMSMSVGGSRVRLPQGNLLSIGRSTLLDVLQCHAAAAGVELVFGSRMEAGDLDADLVIAADGINSTTRGLHADELGASVVTDSDYYLWCGTGFALPTAVFSPVTTEAGTFVTHAYPYATDRSTFLVETDEQTWRRAGFDTTTSTTAGDASDEQALDYLTHAFRAELQGHPLIGNRTRWTQFRTISCQRWHVGNVVLLGDAAHTAHYSIGSGTKLAMEDAITLDGVLADSSSLEEALDRYEAERRPAVEHLQRAAARSMRWWHSFPRRLELPVEQLFVSYMTRAGKVALERFAETAPDVVRRGLGSYAGADQPSLPAHLSDWVVAQPFSHRDWMCLDRRLDEDRVEVVTTINTPEGSKGRLRLLEVEVEVDDTWGIAGDALLAEVRKAVDADCDGVLLTCPNDLEGVLAMLDAAERVHLEVDAVVAARTSDPWRPHLVSGLVSGRIDLLDLTTGAEA
jgi:anthraniloyl-CoA monooxygenase